MEEKESELAALKTENRRLQSQMEEIRESTSGEERSRMQTQIDHVKKVAEMDKEWERKQHAEAMKDLEARYEGRIARLLEEQKDAESIQRLMKNVMCSLNSRICVLRVPPSASQSSILHRCPVLT